MTPGRPNPCPDAYLIERCASNPDQQKGDPGKPAAIEGKHLPPLPSAALGVGPN